MLTTCEDVNKGVIEREISAIQELLNEQPDSKCWLVVLLMIYKN